jgi:hypothetical protein
MGIGASWSLAAVGLAGHRRSGEAYGARAYRQRQYQQQTVH